MRNVIFGAVLFSSAALAAGLSAPALAQDAPTPTAPPMFVSVPADSVLSSNLIGLTVSNAGNETIGEIKDLVVGPGTQLTGIVISVGGFLGIGEHYVVISPATVAVTYNTNDRKWEARVNATADQLKAAPAFVYEGKWRS